MFTTNKYHSLYFKIIKRAQSRILSKDIKVEIHHIVPRSLGGTNDATNLVALTLKEHWICHKLLVRFLNNPMHIRKMYNALYMMAVKDYRQINGRVYQSIKENTVPWNKGLTGLYQPPLNNAAKQKLSQLWKGKPRPQEHRDAMKKGWERVKEAGYSPWNKGLTGLKGPCQNVVLIAPSGEEYIYESLKAGCNDQKLIYTKMSSVKSGKVEHYKGWKVKPVNMA
jgi:hypothetical protein